MYVLCTTCVPKCVVKYYTCVCMLHMCITCVCVCYTCIFHVYVLPVCMTWVGVGCYINDNMSNPLLVADSQDNLKEKK